MPIATGLENEELQAELEGQELFYINFAVGPFGTKVTDQDMEDTYQAPFRSCVEEGKASCFMCSYNAVNGIPACAREDLLQKTRDEWGFKGYITSDCDAVATIFEYQNYAKSPEDAVALSLKTGMDINCGTYLLWHTQSAIDQGKVTEKEIDRALFNLFSVQLRLGLFDGNPIKRQFGKLGPQHVCSLEHKALAMEAAKQGIVLLKNVDNFLPLQKTSTFSLAIIGPMANTTALGGGYTGVPCSLKRLLDAFQDCGKKTSYSSGCIDGVPCNSNAGFPEALPIARDADIVIVVVGLDSSQETEDRDRYSLLLPGYQMALVTAVAAVSKQPLVLVLTGGGGPCYNPGGRLPVTWYPESFTNIPINNMSMRADPSRGYPGRTYLFYTGDTIYGFGHGLSYTRFTYKLLSAPTLLCLSRSIKSRTNLIRRGGYDRNYIPVDELAYCDLLIFHVAISVTNSGDMDGSHVLMLYLRVTNFLKGLPEKQLIGFDRVHTISNQTTETSILVDPCKHLSIANDYGKRVLPLGDHILMLSDLEQIVSVEL